MATNRSAHCFKLYSTKSILYGIKGFMQLSPEFLVMTTSGILDDVIILYGWKPRDFGPFRPQFWLHTQLGCYLMSPSQLSIPMGLSWIRIPCPDV